MFQSWHVPCMVVWGMHVLGDAGLAVSVLCWDWAKFTAGRAWPNLPQVVWMYVYDAFVDTA
jgi:hypothetical protein